MRDFRGKFKDANLTTALKFAGTSGTSWAPWATLCPSSWAWHTYSWSLHCTCSFIARMCPAHWQFASWSRSSSPPSTSLSTPSLRQCSRKTCALASLSWSGGKWHNLVLLSDRNEWVSVYGCENGTPELLVDGENISESWTICHMAFFRWPNEKTPVARKM